MTDQTKVVIAGDTTGAQQAIAAFAKSLDGLTDKLDRVRQTSRETHESVGFFEEKLQEMATAVVAAFSIEKVFEFAGEVKAAALDMEKSNQLIAGALKATQHAAGLTRKEIDELVDSLARSTTFDDDGLKKAAAALLRFRDVQGETFREALKLIPDVATALGTDLVSAAQTLGKALQDPGNGMKGLKAAGVGLTEQQIDLAAKFKSTGDYASAQKVVLDALTQSVGGASGEANQGLTKATSDAGKAWDDFLKAIGRTETYKDSTLGFFNDLTNTLKLFTDAVDGTQGSLVKLGAWIADHGQQNLPGIGLFYKGAAGLGLSASALAPKPSGPTPGDFSNIATETAEQLKAEIGAENQRLLQQQEAAYGRQKKAAEDAKKQTDALIKSANEHANALFREAAAVEDQIAKEEQAADAVGKSKGEQLLLAAAIAEATGMAKEAAAADEEYAAALGGPFADAHRRAADALHLEADAYLRLADAKRNNSVIETAQSNLDDLIQSSGKQIEEGMRIWQKAQDKAETEWKHFTDEIGRGITDMLVRSFEAGGKDGAKIIVDTIKHALLTAAFKIAVEAVVNPVLGAAGQALGIAGAGSQGGGLGNLLGLGSNASSVYNMFSGASGGLSSAFMGGGAGGLYGAFAESSLGASLGLSTAASAGYAAPVFSSALEGSTLLSAGSGTAAGGLTSLGTTVGAALPYVGLALAAYSLLSGGHKEDPHNNPDKTNYQFGLGSQGIYGIGGIGPSMYVSGKTSGSGRWADRSDIDAASIDSINRQAAALYSAGEDLAKVLGVDAAAIRNVKTESPLFGSAAEALGNIANQIATALIPNIADFQQSNETLAQTALRVAGDIQGFDQIAKQLGITLNLAGDAAARAASIERVIAAGGGSQVFAANIADFKKNFFSDAEQQAQSLSDLHDQFNKLGIAMPETKGEFRALVEALMASGEAGEVMAAKVLSMESAFSQAADTAEAAAKQTLDAYKQLSDTLAGDANQLQLGDLSPLTASQKYAAAGSVLNDIWQQVLTGDQSALSELPKSIQDWLTASRAENSSGDAFTQDYRIGQAMLAQARTIAAAHASSGASGATYDIASAVSAAQQQATSSASAAPAAAASSQFAEGSFVRDPATFQVFHVEGGLLRWIPDPGIAESVFGSAWHNAPNSSGAAGIWSSEGGLHIPGYATGLDRVPYDDYLMRAHKDEAVLTAAQASDWRAGQRGINSTDLAGLREDLAGVRSDLRQLGEIVRRGEAANVAATQGLANTQRDIALREDVRPRVR